MYRTIRRVLLIAAALLLFVVPIAAIGAGSFEDVSEDNVFKADIDWLASVGVTKGCNPPANTKYCPDANVTRGQMAAFMHRIADGVVDAGTVEGMTAAELMTGEPGPEGPKGDKGDPGVKGDTGDPGVLGDIVMAVSGSNWRRVGSGTAPSVSSHGSYVLAVGDGLIELGLGAPVMVGTTDYRLKSVEVCYELAGGAYIDQTDVMVASVGANQQFLTHDITDRVASGCHTVTVSASTPNGAAVRLLAAGSGSLNLYGIRATWEPTP